LAKADIPTISIPVRHHQTGMNFRRYSITSLATASSVGGTMRPSALNGRGKLGGPPDRGPDAKENIMTHISTFCVALAVLALSANGAVPKDAFL
jgi:hypothetical protein